MELFIFARFHANDGQQETVAAELRDAVGRARAEPGCLYMGAYRSVRDHRLFWIHSRWVDEAAFEVHAALAQTQAFVERAETLIDHPFDVTRSISIT